MVIIESTEKLEKNWFYSTSSSIKSILCYPIKIGKNIEFIITITSKNENEFKKEEKSTYQLILDELSSRIILESYLNQIKEYKDE